MSKMNPLLKRLFFTVIIVGIVGSIIHGLLALFIFDVGNDVAGYIIVFGSALSSIIGGAVVSTFNSYVSKNGGVK